MKNLEKLLSFGTTENSTILDIQLIHQVNGLNIFYTFVASFAGVLIWLFIPNPLFLILVQFFATIIYLGGIILTGKGYVNVVRRITIYVFELQMFFAIMLTNAWTSGALCVVVVYPLLAALVEVSRFRHLLVSFIQILFTFTVHFFFPGLESRIMNFSSLLPGPSSVVSTMALVTFPLMSAVIIELIFRENLFAREKQKTLLNEITVSNKKLEIYAEKLRDESMRLQAEVNIAKKIQTMVLPSVEEIEQVHSLEIACMMITADEVGGDYYDVINIDDIVTLGIGDVTGHGLSSGIIMLMAQTVIRTMAEMKITEPAVLMSIVNKVLYANIKRIKEDRNMTLALITYKNRRFVVTGQHESVILVRRSGKIEVIDTMNLGFYVGLMPDIRDKIGQLEIVLEPGDLMVLYSDGITEAENTNGVQFGQELLCSCIKKYAELPATKIVNKFMKDLCNYMGESEIQDDISLVVIRQK